MEPNELKTYIDTAYRAEIREAERKLLLAVRNAVDSTPGRRVELRSRPEAARAVWAKTGRTYGVLALLVRNGHLCALIDYLTVNRVPIRELAFELAFADAEGLARSVAEAIQQTENNS